MTGTEIALWMLTWTLIVAGVAGTVLPALPGNGLIFAGAWVGAWIDDFQRVGGVTVGVIGALAVLAFVLDYVAGLLGAKKANASREALIGAAIGTVIGIFMGFIGVFFMPFVGAVAGEYIARREHGGALRVGVATWVGLMVAMAAKVAIAFVMIGIFVVALLL